MTYADDNERSSYFNESATLMRVHEFVDLFQIRGVAVPAHPSPGGIFQLRCKIYGAPPVTIASQS